MRARVSFGAFGDSSHATCCRFFPHHTLAETQHLRAHTEFISHLIYCRANEPKRRDHDVPLRFPCARDDDGGASLDYLGDHDSQQQLDESLDVNKPADDLDASIFSIALPTLATLAADPLASLVSTAWVGRLGAVELAGVGVALSVYGAITKLLNMPLLAVITSTTATALGRSEKGGERSKHVGIAVASALALAAAAGAVQAGFLAVAGLPGLSLWGAGPASPLHASASAYLTVRAWSAPASVVFLALQGTFRGLGDTRAPLLATVASNAINVVLEPLFIFHFRWGVGGAAMAIAVAQVASAAGLWAILSSRVDLKGLNVDALRDAAQYARPTGLLVLRTLAITSTFAVATGLAARTDPAHAAAHQIAFQLWLAASLLADSLAVAAQSLVARSLAPNTNQGRATARAVVQRVTSLSLSLGVALSAGLAVGTLVFPLSRVFTNDPGVLRALGALLPAVVATQPLNALAFTLDGVLYGVNGFGYAARAMTIAAIPAIVTMLGGSWVATYLGAGADGQLAAAWGGLAVVMALRFATIWMPLHAGRRPFDILSE